MVRVAACSAGGSGTTCSQALDANSRRPAHIGRLAAAVRKPRPAGIHCLIALLDCNPERRCNASLARPDWARRIVMGMGKDMPTRTAIRYLQRLAEAGQ
jgi:hypothetical protein